MENKKSTNKHEIQRGVHAMLHSCDDGNHATNKKLYLGRGFPNSGYL